MTERKPIRKKGEPAGASGQVQSLTRGLTLLERIAESSGGVALTGLAMQVGLANSTTHRLLTTLQRLGFVQQVGDLGHWAIGVRSFTVGSAFLGSRDLISVAHPFLQRLVEQAGETANLSVLDAAENVAVLICQVECRKMMRMLAPIGSRMPLHASGAGKALLGALPDARINEILRTTGLARYTPRTIDTPGRIHSEMVRSRKQGFASDDEEYTEGLRCVAACIYNEHRQAVAAISVSGPRLRIPDKQLVHLGSLVMRAAHDITVAYGGDPRAAK